MAGVITVVACDKPPVGTLAALLEHNAPAADALRRLDPPRDRSRDRRAHRPRHRRSSSRPIPTRTCARASRCTRAPARAAAAACSPTTPCRRSSRVLGMEPLHMVAPASDDARRTEDVPRRARRAARRRSPRPASARATSSRRRRCATRFVVVMAMGGSTNVVLHGAEIARAAGFDLWDDVLSQQEFNELSRRLPVLVNMRPVRRATRWSTSTRSAASPSSSRSCSTPALLDGDRAHLHRRDARRAGRAARPAGARRRRRSIPSRTPFKPTGGLRLLRGQPRARRRRRPEGGGRRGRHRRRRFTGRARVFEGERALIAALEDAPTRSPTATSSSSATRVRAARPACPRCSTRPRASPRCAAQRDITIALMTDGRFSGGSVGLVDRPRLARGVPRRPDRADRGRRHDRRRPQRRPPRLPSSSTTPRARAARAAWRAAGDANGGVAPGRGACQHSGARPDARDRAPGAPRRRDGRRVTAKPQHAPWMGRVIVSCDTAR